MKDNPIVKINKIIDEKLPQLVTEVLENPTWGWSISSIPIIGPLLYTVFTSMEPEIMKRRFLELVKSLHEEVTLIDESKVDKSFFSTEVFYDLLRMTLENAAKTRDREKIKLYARILIRTTLLDNVIFRNRVEDFLLIIRELSPADIFVAREVYRQQKELPEEINEDEGELRRLKESGWKRLPEICSMDNAEFQLSVLKLVRAGLLQQVIGMYPGYIGDYYKITPVFKKLIQLIGELI